MKHKLFRGLVALILVCCMIVNCIAIKAEASVLGAAAVLFGDDAALAVIAACLAGLGVMAKLETEMDTLTFRHLCEDAYDAMAAAGEWVVDGAVTVYNCATELWDYGVDCGMVQWLHDWLWADSGIMEMDISGVGCINTAQYEELIDFASSYHGICWYTTSNSYLHVFLSQYPINCSWTDKWGGRYIATTTGGTGTYFYINADGNQSVNETKSEVHFFTPYMTFTDVLDGSGSSAVLSSENLTLGVVAPPGTDIETEYGEYIVIVAPNGVPDTGGDGSGDDQPKIPIIPVPVLPSYEETIQLPQEEIWKGNKVETEDPDTGGSTDPSTGTDTDDPDSGSNDPTTPTTGTDTDPDTGTDVPPADIADYSVDLTSFFPFCLPFDIYAFFELLVAEPETPHLEFDIPFPYMEEPWHLVIDLSAWDETAELLRKLQLLAFIIGLCVFTREKFLRS